jgi:AbrB family looped-hinge helix DNA binding protein
MQAMVDTAGRLVLPKEILQQAGITPGMTLEVHWREGRLEIEPAPLAVKLVRRGRLLVAVPYQGVSPLQIDTVEQTRDTLLQERSLQT